MVDSALPCRRVYGFLDEAWLARFSLMLCTYRRQSLQMPVDRCQSDAAAAAQRCGSERASVFILVDSVDAVDRNWSAAENSLSGCRLAWPLSVLLKKRIKGRTWYTEPQTANRSASTRESSTKHSDATALTVAHDCHHHHLNCPSSHGPRSAERLLIPTLICLCP